MNDIKQLDQSSTIFIFHVNTRLSSICVLLFSVSSLTTASLHDLHAATHIHSTATTSALSGRICTIKTASSGSLLLFASWVSNSLIDREDCAGSLCSSSQYIYSNNLGFPNEQFHKIVDLSTEDINSLPNSFFTVGVMNLSKLVKNVSSVHTRVFSQLLGNNFKSLGETVNHKLLFAFDSSDMFT